MAPRKDSLHRPTSWAIMAWSIHVMTRLRTAVVDRPFCILLVAGLGLCSDASPSAGQSIGQSAGAGAWTLPRTSDGQPDLQGVWHSKSATPLQRPPALADRERLTDEEVAELTRRADRLRSDPRNDFVAGDNLFLAALDDVDRYVNPRSTCNSSQMVEREFDNRTSLVVDPPNGRIPALIPAAQERLTALTSGELHPLGPEDMPSWPRCITRGLPRLGGTSGAGIYSYYQIFQTPGYVVLLMETIHDARIIPLDGPPHLPSGMRQWHGDSRGRWEGETLVVETSNFSAKSTVLGSDENLHLVERFTRVSADTISYEIKVTDPTAWTVPWTVEMPFTRTDLPLYEFACHEGNFHAMVGTLAGARAVERASSGQR